MLPAKVNTPEKIVRVSRKHTAKSATSATVWLARLDAERRFAEPEDVKRAWDDARQQVEGDGIQDIWLWGIESPTEASHSSLSLSTQQSTSPASPEGPDANADVQLLEVRSPHPCPALGSLTGTGAVPACRPRAPFRACTASASREPAYPGTGTGGRGPRGAPDTVRSRDAPRAAGAASAEQPLDRPSTRGLHVSAIAIDRLGGARRRCGAGRGAPRARAAARDGIQALRAGVGGGVRPGGRGAHAEGRRHAHDDGWRWRGRCVTDTAPGASGRATHHLHLCLFVRWGPQAISGRRASCRRSTSSGDAVARWRRRPPGPHGCCAMGGARTR